MTENLYETPKLVSEYLLFHYGSPTEVLPWPAGPEGALGFAVRIVSENLRKDRVPPNAARALDLGCAVGRSSFELARTHEEVVGIDYSAAFIQAADNIARNGKLRYLFAVEGNLAQEAIAEVPDGVDPQRVTFEVGDACALREDLGSFDTVLAANLLCRLPEPEACIQRFPSLVKPGGQLIITSPYTWMEDYTPQEKWLGGKSHNGAQVRSLDGLRERLEDEFDLLEKRDQPFLIREHQRKYQWSVAQASVWIRKQRGEQE
jgi:putative 4-mercaptohistidine N1-methyltranferase